MSIVTRGPENDRVALAIQAAMRKAGMNGADLAAKLVEVRGEPLPYTPSVYVSKRTTGKIRLIEPERVVYRATSELEEIAKALGVSVASLVREANRKPTQTDTEAEAADASHRDKFDEGNDQAAEDSTTSTTSADN